MGQKSIGADAAQAAGLHSEDSAMGLFIDLMQKYRAGAIPYDTLLLFSILSKENFQKFATLEMRAAILGLLRGTHRVVAVEKPVAVFTLETTNASMPQIWSNSGWKVEEHRGLGVVEVRFADGEMYINDRKVDDYLAEKQKVGVIGGHDLRKELVDKPTLPDAILDLLIREQDKPGVKLFLQKYKGRYLFFWSTIYRNPDGNLCIRSLYGDGKRFGWPGRWLVVDWGAGAPALVLAPPPVESGT